MQNKKALALQAIHYKRVAILIYGISYLKLDLHKVHAWFFYFNVLGLNFPLFSNGIEAFISCKMAG
jgi:hypothetical protein